MDLVHHQPTDVARVRGLDHHDDIIGAGDRVGRAHAGHTTERPDDRPDLTRLRLDQDIGSGVHNSTSPSQALGDTPRAAPMRLSCRVGYSGYYSTERGSGISGRMQNATIVNRKS